MTMVPVSFRTAGSLTAGALPKKSRRSSRQREAVGGGADPPDGWLRLPLCCWLFPLLFLCCCAEAPSMAELEGWKGIVVPSFDLLRKENGCGDYL